MMTQPTRPAAQDTALPVPPAMPRPRFLPLLRAALRGLAQSERAWRDDRHFARLLEDPHIARDLGFPPHPRPVIRREPWG